MRSASSIFLSDIWVTQCRLNEFIPSACFIIIFNVDKGMPSSENKF